MAAEEELGQVFVSVILSAAGTGEQAKQIGREAGEKVKEGFAEGRAGEQAAGEFTQQFGGALGNLASQVGSKLMPGLSGVFSDAGKAGGGLLMAGAGVGIIEGAKNVADSVKGAMDLVTGEFKAVGKVGEDAANALMGGFTSLVQGRMPDVMSAFNVMEEAVKTGLQAPLNVLSTEIDNTLGRLPLIGEAFKGMADEMQSAFAGVFEVFDEVKGLGGGVLQTLVDIGDQYLGMARKIASTSIDSGQTTGLLKDIRDILSSGAEVNAEQLAGSIGRLATNLTQLDNSQLKAVATTLSEATQLVGNIDPTKISGVLNAFSISGEDANQTLTQLVNISRATGIGIDDLTTAMTTAGPAMRELGFSAQETGELFGDLTKSGEPAVRLAQSLNKAVASFTKEGIDPAEGLRSTVQSIKDLEAAGNHLAALKLGEQIFGSRAAPQFIEDIKNGMVSIGDQGQVVVRQIDGINQPLSTVLEQTKTIGEAFEVVGNQVTAALAPIGTVLAHGLVEGGSKISDWLKENQGKVIQWGVDVSTALLGGFGHATKFMGDLLAAMGPWLEVAKNMFVTWASSIVFTIEVIAKAWSHLPGFLGGDAAKDAVSGLDDAQKALDKIGSVDLAQVFDKGAAAADNFATNVIPKAQQAIRDTGQQAQQSTAMTRAFTQSVGGQDQDAFKLLTDAQGNMVQGGPEGQGVVKLLGTPAQQQETLDKFKGMGIQVTTDANGVVTGIIDNSKHQWDQWWSDQKQHPPKAPVTITPQTEDGTTINDSGDLVTPGSTTVTVSANTVPLGQPQPLPGAVPVPGAPSAVGAPGAYLPSGTSGTGPQISAALAAAGLTPGEIKGILAMNTVEGGDTNPSSALGFNDQQAQGLPAKIAAFMAQFNDPARRQGGAIPGVDAQGNVTDPAAFLTWIREKIVGQNGAPGQPAPGDYQARLVAAYNGATQGVPTVPPMPTGAPTSPGGTYLPALPTTATTAAPVPVTTPPGAVTIPAQVATSSTPPMPPPGATGWMPGSDGKTYYAADGDGKPIGPSPPATPPPPAPVNLGIDVSHGQPGTIPAAVSGSEMQPTPYGAEHPHPGIPPGIAVKPDGSIDVGKMIADAKSQGYNTTPNPAYGGFPTGPPHPLPQPRPGETMSPTPRADNPWQWFVHHVGDPIAGGFGDLGSSLGFHTGGEVHDPNSCPTCMAAGGSTDTIPAMLTAGEYVVNKKQATQHRGLLDSINSGMHGFQTGGVVGPDQGQQPLDTQGAQVDTIAVGYAVEKAFGITDMGFYRAPDNYDEHSSGEAVDVMVGGNTSQGTAVKDFALANASAYGVLYALWQQRQWNPDGTSSAMEDRGSPTQNHMNHVHIRTSGGGYPQGGGPGAQGAVTAGHGWPEGTVATPAAAAASGSSYMPSMPGSAATVSGSSAASPGGGDIGPQGKIWPGYNPWTNPPPGLSQSQMQTYTADYERKQHDQTTNQAAVDKANTDYATAQRDQTTALQAQTPLTTDYNQKLGTWNNEKDMIGRGLSPEEQQKVWEGTPDYKAMMAAYKAMAENQKKLDDANTKLTDSTDARRSALDKQAEDDTTGPPKPPGEEKDKGDKDSEALGKGLVSGVLQELGFPDVFGKSLTEGGLWKLFTGGLGYGAGLLDRVMDQGGTGTGGTPAAEPNRGLGFIEGLFPSLKTIINPPGVDTETPWQPNPVGPTAMVTSETPVASPIAYNGTGPAPGPGLTVNNITNGPTFATQQQLHDQVQAPTLMTSAPQTSGGQGTP